MKDRLFYDGLCPLCLKEIDLLKRLVKSELEFIDINQIDATSFNTSNFKISNKDISHSKEQLLKRLHLQRSDGNWLIGLDANVYIWSKTRLGRLLHILRWPMIRTIADIIYNNWADRRYKKNYQCGICIK